MKFYPHRTVGEQTQRLPTEYQGNYARTQIDRIEIDGVELQGYFEYSFLEEKSYIEQPMRSNDGVIELIEDYKTILTPRLIINYSMMDIEDYRTMMKLFKSKNAFIVTCYDIVEDKRVSHEMYVAPQQMPVIYQQYLKVLGIQNTVIELIGTNKIIDQISTPPIISISKNILTITDPTEKAESFDVLINGSVVTTILVQG